MFQFLVLIGAAITVTATCAAFLLDSATESERARHDGLMDEAERTRDSIAAARAQQAGHWQAQLRQQASYHRQRLLDELARLSVEHRQVEEEVGRLEIQLARELGQAQQNPFRRRTLLQGAARIEDARARLDGHRAYRQHLADTLERHWAKDQFEAVLELDPPTFTLPAEWLYVGKALLIDAAEDLDRPLRFGQRLQLTNEPLPQGFSDTRQRLHLANYPDSRAVPIQVIKQDAKNPRKFFACVARGVLYYDHIFQHEPLDFRVERRIGTVYLGSLFDGSLRAILPSNRLPDPSQRLLPGQAIPVWPEMYDLLFNRAPGMTNPHGKVELPQVSARAPAEFDPQTLRLTLAVSEATAGAELLDNDLALDAWRLSHYDASGERVTLLNGRIRVQCELDRQRHLLIASRCEAIAENIDGLMLPIPIEPCDARLVDEPYLQSPAGLDCLLQLAMQARKDPERERLRAAQVHFLSRWREVLDYQQETLATSVAFNGTAHADGPSSESWQLTVDADAEFCGDLGEWSETYHQLTRDYRHVQVILELWRVTGSGQDQREDWHAVVWRDRIQVLECNARSIVIRWIPPRGVVRREIDGQPRRYQLRVLAPDESLARQRAALEAFSNDRLVEPALKECLLVPGSHSPGVDREWAARVAAGLPWRNRALTPTQRQVIETCLTASHLAVVQGPPGTAKTTCIVELLHQIYAAAPATRVLLVSQQNTAVDNALARFIASAGLTGHQVRLLRIGHEDRIQPELRDHALAACIDREYARWLETARRQQRHQPLVIADIARRWETLVQGLRPATTDERETPDPEVAELILNGHPLVGATCVGLAKRRLGLDRLTFDLAIIDEAGRATVPELLIPLLRTRKAILIGDHHQLPPAVAPLLREEKTREDLPFLDAAFLETSFFETLYRALPDSSRAQLSEQYRMAPAIGDLVADLFYTEAGQRRLVNGERQPDHDTSSPLVADPLVWVDVRGRQEPGRHGKSLRNPAEARAIVRFLAQQAASAVDRGGKDVAVITPYRAQVNCILDELRRLDRGEGHDDASIVLGGLRVKVDTVDSFQGSEAHLVCYSTVRTQGALSFLLDKKRLNVACSRARENLVFFGHADYLSRYHQPEQRNLFADILPRTARSTLEQITRQQR